MIIVAALLAQTWHPTPCKDPRPGGDARCAARELAGAERQMSSEFVNALERLKECKPRNSTACYNMSRAILLVQKEQQSWKAYRDSHCDVFAFGTENTSVHAIVRDSCRTELTVARIDAIKKIGRR